MFRERTFQIALIVSLLAHGAILYNFPRFDVNLLKKSLQKIEITYQELQIPKLALTSFPDQEFDAKHKTDFNKIYVKKESRVFPPEFSKKPLEAEKKFFQSKPDFVKKLESSKKVTLPETETKIDNPTYLNYYQIIREIIRRSAFRNFTKMHSGEVYLTFVILSNGVLEKINLIEEKSQADDYLKQIALKSLKEASPFPAFPQDLKYPELSFNVIISFEIGD